MTDSTGSAQCPTHWRELPPAPPLASHGQAPALPNWEALRHSANEWADMAGNGLQWLRNIAEGISDAKTALADMEKNLAHCREVNDAPEVQVAVRAAASATPSPPTAQQAPVTLWGHAFEYVDKNLLPHADDVAVDRFAVAMKEKLAAARAKGRGGWDSAECTQQRLSDMLREHVAKGDPRDVANFCMFLWCREQWIAQPPPADSGAQQAPGGASASGLQEQHDRDSRELRSLCESRDQARRERDECKAEIAGLEASCATMGRLIDDPRKDGDRLEWVLRRCAGSWLRAYLGVASDTGDMDELRVLIDANRGAAPAAPSTPAAGGWISVDDWMPEPGQNVAFVVRTVPGGFQSHLHGRVLGGRFLLGQGFSVPGLSLEASHWQPLPASPTIEGESK